MESIMYAPEVVAARAISRVVRMVVLTPSAGACSAESASAAPCSLGANPPGVLQLQWYCTKYLLVVVVVIVVLTEYWLVIA
jgi:hypothetical protein